MLVNDPALREIESDFDVDYLFTTHVPETG